MKRIYISGLSYKRKAIVKDTMVTEVYKDGFTIRDREIFTSFYCLEKCLKIHYRLQTIFTDKIDVMNALYPYTVIDRYDKFW